MTTESPPRCPKCGHADLTLFKQQPRYAATDPLHHAAPIDTSYAFTCEACGLSFTHEDSELPESTRRFS